MRVLVVHPGPAFSVADVYNGVTSGLEQNGCTVARFNLDARLGFYTGAHLEVAGEYRRAFSPDDAYTMAAKGLQAALYEFWPDVVVIMSGWFIPPTLWAILKRRPHKVVYWCTESPYEDDRQSSPARHADVVILNDPTNLDWYRSEVNPNTHYLPHSYDPAVHHPGVPVPELVCDFGFVGTGFPSRLDFIEAVNWSGIDVKLGGNWRFSQPDSCVRDFLIHDLLDCMDNKVTADVYRSSRVSANLYRKEHSDGGTADGWAMGPREVELAACRTFFLREPRPEGDEVFPMLPTFSDPWEFEQILRFYLADEDAREDAAIAAQAAVADRTFQHTAARMLRLVEGVDKQVSTEDVLFSVNRSTTPQPA